MKKNQIYGVGLLVLGSAIASHNVLSKDETRNDLFKLTLAFTSLILVSAGTYIVVKK